MVYNKLGCRLEVYILHLTSLSDYLKQLPANVYTCKSSSTSEMTLFGLVNSKAKGIWSGMYVLKSIESRLSNWLASYDLERKVYSKQFLLRTLQVCF